jgi:WD40 repeat protein
MFNFLKRQKPEKSKKPAGKTTGTILRSAEPLDTVEKNKSLLQLAEEGGWEVKSIPEYNIGDTIDGTYKIAKKFSGGMGFVYITEPTGQGIQFAIKQPNRLMLENKSFFARIIREADTWNGLGIHPNIAYCYFVKLVDGIPCIFIEYVEGGNLRGWIAEGQCLDIRASLDMAIQFCHGMEHAHKKGVIHRDIKPENILMTREGGVKITDFGLAGALEGVVGKVAAIKGGDLTRFGDVMGTEAYMAPEQWEGPHNVDERADIFSFGVCMWEMFCGKRPYKIAYGENIEIPTPAQTLRSELTDRHVKLLYKCIDLNKKKRYKDFTELRDALNRIYCELYNEDAPKYTIELPDSLADELNNRGYSCYQLGDKQKAMQYWEQSLQITPKHLMATYNLNYLKWDNGEITGDELLKQLKLTENRSHEYWLCIGWIYYLQGDYEAVQEIQESQNKIFDPQFLDALEQPDRPMIRLVKEFAGHTYYVSTVCFSPDGKNILSGSNDMTIRLWDASTGKEIRRFEGHNKSINSVCFSPDGKFVLSGSYDSTIRLWEVGTGKETRKFKGHTSNVSSVCFSPDGKNILSGSGDNTIRLWEAATGKEIRRFEGHTETIFGITSVCFSADGRYILSGAWDNTIRLWEAATGKEIRKFEGHTSQVSSVCFSPDGKLLLSGSRGYGDNADNTVRLWEVATGKEIRRFEGLEVIINSVCFSLDGKLFLSGSGGYGLIGAKNTVSLCEVATGKRIRRFGGHTGDVNSVCFSNDGRYILSGSNDNTIRLWEFSYSPDSYISKFSFPVLSLISSTSEQMFELQKNANLLFKEASLAKESANCRRAINLLRQIQELEGYGQKPEILEFITVCRREGKGTPTGLRDIWVKTIFEGHTGSVESVCFSPDGKFVLSGSYDNTIRLWDASTGKEIRRFEGHPQSISSVCFSADGRYILSGAWDNTIRLWDASTGKEIRKFEGHTSGVLSVCYSPDRKFVLSGSVDNTIRLWEASTGKEIRKFELHTKESWLESVNSVCFSPDGKNILSGCSDNTIRLWEAATGKEIRRFEGHTSYVKSVCFSPDGRFILSGSYDSTIRIWEVYTGKEIRRLEGHTNHVNSVCFSPEGKFVLSSGGEIDNNHLYKYIDCTIRLWEVATGKEIMKYEGHTKTIESVCFSTNGRYILSGSSDMTIFLWELDWEWEFPK